MNSKLIKSGLLSLLTVLFLFTSCSDDDSNSNTETEVTADFTVEQSKQAAETDEVSTGALDVVEMGFIAQAENNGNSFGFFSDCVTITVSTENGVTFVDLDFGMGCELNNGNIVSGIIHLTYGLPQNGTRAVNYTFENFTFNEKEIEGGGTIYRELSNAAGNPQSTFHKNITITHPNGIVAIVNGNRVREWIEGVGSGTWMDNAFLVTGNWSTEFSDGHSRSAMVTEPLRRESTCPFFVSGLLEVTRNITTGELNFGDGTCDNEAILTVNGEEIIIILHH
mgnify:CR=1 FL=1